MRGGILFRLLAALVVAVALFGLVWMVGLPWLVTREAEARTGYRVSVKSLMVNPFTGRVVAREVRLLHPVGFPREAFMTIARVDLTVAMRSLQTDRVVVDSMAVDLANVSVLLPSMGANSLAQFWRRLAGRPELAPTLSPERLPKRFLIKAFNLRVGVVAVASAGDDPTGDRVTALNQAFTFHEVTDLRVPATAVVGALARVEGGVAAPEAKPLRPLFSALEEKPKP